MIGRFRGFRILELGPQSNGGYNSGNQTGAHCERIPKSLLPKLAFFSHKLAGFGHEFPDFDLELIELQIIAVIL
jgi:hypothetical protein